jgi:nitroreductase
MVNTQSIKKAITEHRIMPEIASRWSPRAFSDRTIEPEKLQSLFEAARWAASANNLQPWYFQLGYKGDQTYNLISDTLVDFNKLWALNAPVLIAAIARIIKENGEENHYAFYDLGQAVANMAVQATSVGLYIHQMGGFDREQIIPALGIPASYKPVVVIAAGYLGDENTLHPNLLKLEIQPRTRRLISETVFSVPFGTEANFH